MKGLTTGVAATALLTSMAACGSIGRADDGAAGVKQVTLTVYAAASLTDTFTDIGKTFEAEHQGVKVVFSFGGSSTLVAQLEQGAPADVFASADTRNMAKATADSLIEGTPTDFATNTLMIAVPPGNPAHISTVQDLTRSGLKVVLCAPEVPCGAAAKTVETSSGVDIKPVSEEQSVTDVLTKVETGEADAGLVYVTDVKGAGDKVEGIGFKESSAAVNTYLIGAIKDSKNADLAAQFVRYVAGAEGQAVLATAGFAKP